MLTEGQILRCRELGLLPFMLLLEGADTCTLQSDERAIPGYATGAVNLRSGPGTTFDKVGSLATGDSATRTGIGTGEAENWSRIMLDSVEEVYVSSNYLSLTKPAVQQAQSVNASSGGSGGSGAQQAQTASSEASGGLSAEEQAAILTLQGRCRIRQQKPWEISWQRSCESLQEKHKCQTGR